jgi:hypothetical protein
MVKVAVPAAHTVTSTGCVMADSGKLSQINNIIQAPVFIRVFMAISFKNFNFKGLFISFTP